MNSNYDTETPKCSIITMETMNFLVLNTAPTHINSFTKNVLCCVYTNSVKPDINQLAKNTYSDVFGKWVINYHENYKVITNKVSDVKYFFHNFGTETMEY